MTIMRPGQLEPNEIVMTIMRPGQLEPNEFERAILRRLARQEPSLGESLERLHVLSRQFTGVGSFTRFKCGDSIPDTPQRPVALDALIRMPGVPNGMGAVLFCIGDQPVCLEVYAYGDDLWDGVYDGFSFEETA
jgi:hypothetical protein